MANLRNRCGKVSLLLRGLKDENGQDLVEYAAVIALVVLALTGGMTTLASGINTAMSSLGSSMVGLIG